MAELGHESPVQSPHLPLRDTSPWGREDRRGGEMDGEELKGVVRHVEINDTLTGVRQSRRRCMRIDERG